MNENLTICQKCGGECCKRTPGAAFPEDFPEPLLQSLIDAFTSGNWSIDWWHGDPRDEGACYADALFVRPAVKGRWSTHLFDPSWGGACTFLTTTGCSLEPDKRPFGCRNLIPREEMSCDSETSGNSKQYAAIKWIPHAQTILDAAKEAIPDAKGCPSDVLFK